MLVVSITTIVNRVATASLVYQDGAAANGDFKLSNSETFKPGAEIEILGGSSDEPVVLFKGIVIGQRLKVRDASAPQLIVSCKHKTMKMTVNRNNAYFFDKSDGDVITDLFEAAGLNVDVAGGSVTHPQLVQYQATDWDYCLMRAQANGWLVLTREDEIIVKAPDMSGSSVCNLEFGATVLEMDLKIDARYQFGSIKSESWDIANQAVVETEAENPGFSGLGNLGSDELADVIGLDSYSLSHPQLSSDEAQSWANGKWIYSQVNRVNGRVKCEGIGVINVGDIVTLSGSGDRFNGEAYVSAVRHDFDLVQGWKTNIQFGGIESLEDEKDKVSAPKSSGLLPGINGLQIGVVVSNEDPSGEFRVRVKMPLVDNEDEGTWARVSCLDAGDERGSFFRPEIGDEVVLGFLNDDPRNAIILGMLNSSAKPAPLEGSDNNHEKVLQTRSNMKLFFDDDQIIARLETPAGNVIELSEEDQAISLTDQHGNSIKMNADGISIESASAFSLSASTESKFECGNSMEISSGADVKLEGSAGVEVSSSASVKILASLVEIN